MGCILYILAEFQQIWYIVMNRKFTHYRWKTGYEVVQLWVILTAAHPYQYAVKAQTSLAPLSRFCGSCVTTAHAHQCCIFQSYAKTVPSRMKLTMKLTMCEPAFMGCMTTDTWSRHVTSDFNSVFQGESIYIPPPPPSTPWGLNTCHMGNVPYTCKLRPCSLQYKLS